MHLLFASAAIIVYLHVHMLVHILQHIGMPVSSWGIVCLQHQKCMLVLPLQMYDKCFLGSSPSATPDSTFQGQMAAVYLFREQLNKETIAALYRLRPGYKVRLTN